MEADSTTYESTKCENEDSLPFYVCPENFKLYKSLTLKDQEKSLECQIVERMQQFGLLPNSIECPTAKPECKVVNKTARVIDKIQWLCQGCGKRQPIRTGSFFFRMQCSLLQSLGMILAWCEDADCEVAAEHFNVKQRVACMVYDRLDDIAVKEQNKCKLGGENSIVLAEMYPDCLNRLSPDTTDQPHVHRILMLADTNHIPTHYQLHVIRDDLKRYPLINSMDCESLKNEIEEVIARVTVSDSMFITGHNIPSFEGVSSVQQLAQHCNVDMQHFLNSRIWRQAVSLCAASRDLCSGVASTICASAVQRYLSTALYRLQYGDGFFEHMLRLIANEYTDKHDPNPDP